MRLEIDSKIDTSTSRGTEVTSQRGVTIDGALRAQWTETGSGLRVCPNVLAFVHALFSLAPKILPVGKKVQHPFGSPMSLKLIRTVRRLVVWKRVDQ